MMFNVNFWEIRDSKTSSCLLPQKIVLLILRGEKKLYFLVSLKKVVYLLNTSEFKIRNMGATLAPGCLRHITS